MALDPKVALRLIQLRRNLKGTVTTANAALDDVERVLAHIQPQCRPCFFQHGLIEECKCANKPRLDLNA